ncbi:MAG: hypothetical protein A2W22_01070 [Candidatus Levybacteria bacterium RBG_16_35_11]|nr:MAG: hypothetical protein A2W22_01070 [Candidatus Levybacteria bacterium RBG_16_35_11]
MANLAETIQETLDHMNAIIRDRSVRTLYNCPKSNQMIEIIDKPGSEEIFLEGPNGIKRVVFQDSPYHIHSLRGGMLVKRGVIFRPPPGFTVSRIK